MLKKTLIGLGVVIVLLVAAAVIVPMLIPAETYKKEIAEQVRAATGREFAMKGDASVSFFPVLGVEVNDVALGNAKGAEEPQMATLARMVVALKLLPLLSGQVEIDRFVLVDPVIHLEVDKSGRPNWEFAAAPAAGAETSAPKTAQAPAGKAPGGGFDVQALRLGEVRLENGTVTYSDRRSGQKVLLTAINMDLELPSIDQPMVAEGGATWNKEAVELELRVESPRNLLEGKETPLSLAVQSRPVKLAFKGSAAAAKALKAAGDVDLDVPSVRDLAAWAGSPLEFGGPGFGPLKVKGRLGVEGPRYSFANAEIAFDEIRGKGELGFDGGRKVPYVSAKLDVERLDLNPYLPPEGGGAAAGTGGGTPQAGSGGGAPAGASEWSDAPIDASALRTIDADLAFSSGEILMRKVRIDSGALEIALSGGKLTTNLTKLQLYKGQGSGQVFLDASGKTLALKQQFNVVGIEARPLLSDAANTDWLEGTGNLTVNLTGRGNSERQIVSSLNGNGDFKFNDGAVYGINVAEIVRLVGTGGLKAIFDPKSLNATPKTDFAELSGTYVVEQGIVKNNDLLMLSPLLRVQGAGTADMPQRTVNYRLEPKVVGTIEGQGGEKSLKGITVPLQITGPWHAVRVTPDIAAALTSDPAGVLKGILGGGAATGGAEGAAVPAGEPKKGLEGVVKELIKPKQGTEGTEGGGQGGGAPTPEDAVKSLKKLLQ